MGTSSTGVDLRGLLVFSRAWAEDRVGPTRNHFTGGGGRDQNIGGGCRGLGGPRGEADICWGTLLIFWSFVIWAAQSFIGAGAVTGIGCVVVVFAVVVLQAGGLLVVW